MKTQAFVAEQAAATGSFLASFLSATLLAFFIACFFLLTARLTAFCLGIIVLILAFSYLSAIASNSTSLALAAVFFVRASMADCAIGIAEVRLFCWAICDFSVLEITWFFLRAAAPLETRILVYPTIFVSATTAAFLAARSFLMLASWYLGPHELKTRNMESQAPPLAPP